jgi:hypothetical protein
MQRFRVLLSGRARRVGALVLAACLLVVVTDGADVLHARGAASQTGRQLTQARSAADARLALVLGGRALITSSHRDGAGRAEGFRFLDRTPGVARGVAVYVGAGSRSRTLVVGLYSDGAGRPRSLLASGSASLRRTGGWVTVAVRRTTIVRGRSYWVAVLGSGGVLEIRGDRRSPCRSETDPAAGLRDLPRSWRSGGASDMCVSAYVIGSRSTVASAPVTTSTASPPSTVTPPSASSPPTQAAPRTEQSVAFWLAWSGTIQESQIPWRAVTQVDLFSLTSNTKTSGCAADCTRLNANPTGISRMNVPAWVAAIHHQGKQAIISIGGSNDQDWAHACAAANLPGFASKLVSYMVSNGFDGVDIDIESLQGAGAQLTLWSQCVQAIAQAAHHATTQAGKTPIVSTDVDQSWMDPAVATFAQWPDQFNLMYYGYPTGSYSCANSCAKVNALVQELHVTGQVPYDKMVLGMSPGGGQAPCCYTNLASTAAVVGTGGSLSSIPLSSGLSAALPAGNVVLSSGGNPPAHDEVFTTPGANKGATTIPISGTVSGSGGYAFPSGSKIQSDYSGPWDCANFAQYAASTGLEGVMIWDLQEEAAEHNGQFPCFDQVAPFIGSPP